jgi:hypothetical protein
MLPRHSAPDSVLWPVIVSRVPGRLIGLLKPGLLGPRKRVTVAPLFQAAAVAPNTSAFLCANSKKVVGLTLKSW